MQLIGVHAEIVGDIVRRRCRHRHQIGNPAGDFLLHGGEAVPAVHRGFAPPLRRVEVEHSVPSDGVVHGGHYRNVLRDLEQARSQALVVVHHIELGAALRQQPRRAQAERSRFWEPTGPHGGQFQQIDAVADLARVRNPERIRFAVQVEAGDLGESDPRIEYLGIGLTGEHLDLVAEFDQTPTQVADINALATAVRLTAVGQQRDPHAHAPPGVGHAAAGKLDMCPPYKSPHGGAKRVAAHEPRGS